jgi:type I restriction enzyme M protein
MGEIFGEIKNKFQSGYSLRDALELMDGLRFRSQKEKHELSHLYEAKIKNMGNAGRNGGEYYTPRPLIRAMIQVVKPKIGERIYDGALGSAAFLCEAHDYLRQGDLTTSQLHALQTKTFYGKEKKSLAYVIAIMNMILHGIEAPNVVHTNTLAENISDIQDKDRFDVILANPPFGGKERPEVQQNFPIKTGETAFLFLQHFIKSLKAGGRAAIVIRCPRLSPSPAHARRSASLSSSQPTYATSTRAAPTRRRRGNFWPGARAPASPRLPACSLCTSRLTLNSLAANDQRRPSSSASPPSVICSTGW